ncbi:hypothetical protein BDQ17DRAFT_1366715 [Cyathus striatus]|nr:hypothetical protein BDQ17DRAFT_1366715 [Cyathus striatus]
MSEWSILLVELPVELIYHVFHFGALESTSFCVTLSLTCSWTRHFVLPYLYRTLIITTLGSNRALLNTLKTPLVRSPTPDYNTKAFPSNLWISAVSNSLLGLFRKCYNLSNLALHVDNFLWLVHSSSPQLTRFTYLPRASIEEKPDFHILIFMIQKADWSLSRFVSTDSNKMSPMFSKVTHLRLAGAIQSYATYLDIDHFTRLSHLAIPFINPQLQHFSDLDSLLLQRKFDCSVLTVYDDEIKQEERGPVRDWIWSRRKQGDNVCMWLSPSTDALQAEWEDEVRNGMSVWKKAEAYTAANIT